jgi:hypothetical protein
MTRPVRIRGQLFVPENEEERRLFEMMSDTTNRLMKVVRGMFKSEEAGSKRRKAVYRFMADMYDNPEITRSGKGAASVWRVVHHGTFIAEWKEESHPGFGDWLSGVLLQMLGPIIQEYRSADLRKTGHGERMLRQRLAQQGMRSTKADAIYADYLAGARDVAALAIRHQTTSDYVRQSIRDHANPDRRKYRRTSEKNRG